MGRAWGQVPSHQEDIVDLRIFLISWMTLSLHALIRYELRSLVHSLTTLFFSINLNIGKRLASNFFRLKLFF
jgi:hypothetical protein